MSCQNKKIKLGVNIDHVATLRQARMINYPDPIAAALLCRESGCDSIVAHLREDRRHINDKDIVLIKEKIGIKFNLEMSSAEEIVKIALKICPKQVTLVPEKRQELTTEGGLDVKQNFTRIKEVTQRFIQKGIEVSLFINPDQQQIDYSKNAGADFVEFHTGCYANALSEEDRIKELGKLKNSCHTAHLAGLGVNAGHGLNYENVKQVVCLPYLEELNIGHSIIARAVFVGIQNAVKEMLGLLNRD